MGRTGAIPRIEPLLALVGVLGLLACAVDPQEIPARLAALGRPHVVLIVVDTLRADVTTPYGSPQDTTPELSRWAGRGVLFERVRAQSSWTKMSMASMLTSTWPRTNGIHSARDALGASHRTLAEILREAGYATQAVQTNGWLHQSFDFHRGFERYAFPHAPSGAAMGRPMLWPHADRVLEEAFRLIDARDPTRPLFLYLHFMDVHEYASPPDFQRFGTSSFAAYLAATGWVDDAVRRLRTKLASAGVLDRTVMILTADHGETFGEHGVWGHARDVLTPVVSVPLVFRFPFAVKPLRVATQVRSIDIAPTVLDLAGIGVPAEFEGRSLVGLIRGGEEDDRVSHADLGQRMFVDALPQSAVSDGHWTFARNRDAPEEQAELLFDRRVDPGENVNLVDREAEVAARMRAVLDAYLAEAREAGRRGVEIDPGIADRLRAMGYLTQDAE